MALIGGATLFVVCCLCAGILAIRGQTQKQNATASAAAVGATAAPSEVVVPTAESTATPEVVVTVQREGGWTSWAAGNFLFGVIAVDRDIIAYGPGSVTVWDRFTGDIVDRFTTGGGGAWRFDSAKGDWQEFSQQTGDMPTYNLYGVARDADGNIYFAAEGAGLIRFDGDEFSQRIVPNIPGPPSLGKIIPAPDGMLWFVEAYGARVAVLDPLAETWSEGPGDIPGPPLFFDSQERLWVSEYDQGFWIIDGSERIHIGAEHGLTPDYQIRDTTLAPDGTAWPSSTGRRSPASSPAPTSA